VAATTVQDRIVLTSDQDRARSGSALREGDRWLVALCLAVSAASHALVPEHLREARYIGIAFAALAAASVLLALALVVRDRVVVWGAVAVLEGLAVAAYVASRTVGLPLLGNDIGSWAEPLSFPALVSELIATAVALTVLRRVRSRSRG
jgi:hypothetical protein